jgi:hypothetical protein
MTQTADSVEAWAARSGLVFLGAVDTVGPPPGRWSGYFASWQEVHYRVDAIVKGSLPGAGVVVRHVVVKGSPLAEPGDIPRLASSLFHAGARLLVMAAGEGDGTWSSWSERFGALTQADAPG